ncbi:MAG: AAA family ATPase [Capsulimonadaceae bacterium]
MGIITIARQLGAGEAALVPAVAARLGWRVADQSILNREAEITGISLPHAAHWDEHDPTFVERLHGQGPEFATFLQTSRQVMQELAAEGSVVIVGRGGHLLLRGHPDTLHVRLIADMPFRLKQVMEVRWVANEVASALIAKHDRNSATYYRHIFHTDISNPAHYDMVLRTDRLGIERAVDVIAGYFEHPAPALPGEGATRDSGAGA